MDPMDPGQANGSGQTGQADSIQAALPPPSIVTAGSSKVTATTSSAGPGLMIVGGTDLASYARGSYWIATGALSATAEFTVNPAPGASFFYELMGSGTGYTTRQLRLQRVPGSDALQAVAATGTITCGSLASGQPTEVTLAFDGVARTFDVLIAGAPSACTDLPASLQGPITGFRMMDPGNLGYGGQVEFTNLALF